MIIIRDMVRGMAFAAMLMVAAPVSAFDTIRDLHWYPGHNGLLFRTTDLLRNPDDCARMDFYILAKSHQHFDQLYAAFLTAFSTGRRIEFSLVGCVDGLPTMGHMSAYP